MQAAKPESIKVPKRYEILKGWCLPMLANAFEAEEKEQEALELFNSINRLKERYSK